MFVHLLVLLRFLSWKMRVASSKFPGAFHTGGFHDMRFQCMRVESWLIGTVVESQALGVPRMNLHYLDQKVGIPVIWLSTDCRLLQCVHWLSIVNWLSLAACVHWLGIGCHWLHVVMDCQTTVFPSRHGEGISRHVMSCHVTPGHKPKLSKLYMSRIQIFHLHTH